MYKITVKGLSGGSDSNDESKLDGIDCQDNFSEYFGVDEHILKNKGVEGGDMTFKYENNQLYVYVVYSSAEKLDNNEIEILKEYTTGQMSDGIGEGFEQYPCMVDDGKEIYLSPWYPGQKLTVTQIELGLRNVAR